MSHDEYVREMNMHGDHSSLKLPPEVLAEHEKINRSEGLAFVFPLWWSECPAKLKGWFDRVWVRGFAYVYPGLDEKYSMPTLSIDKALVLCPAGHTQENLEQTGIAQSMRNTYLNDRLRPAVGIKQADIVLLTGMTEGDEDMTDKNLETAYQAGRDF